MKPRRRGHLGGHNLLEMMVATMIFATAMISIASVYQYIAKASAKARVRMMGQYLAKGLMEECVAAKYYNVVNLASSSGNLTLPSPVVYDPIEMIFRRNGQVLTHTFNREVQVDDSTEAIFNSGGTRARLVRVRVTWEEQNMRGAGAPYAEYRTYIGQNS